MESVPRGIERLTPLCFFLVTQYLDVRSISMLSLTNKQMKALIDHPSFWESYHKFAHPIKISGFNLSDLKSRELFKFVYTSLPALETCEIQLKGIEASSTDYDQSIHRVLNDSTWYFWSSTGSLTIDNNEYLIFEVCEPTFIRSLELKFYLQYGSKAYMPKEVCISLGVKKDEWNYHSQNFPINGKLEHRFTMPDQACLAKYIKVTFIKKLGLQASDQQYYIAVNRIKVLGCPIKELNNKVPLELLDKTVNFLDEEMKAEECEDENNDSDWTDEDEESDW